MSYFPCEVYLRFRFSMEKRIQPQSSGLSPNGQDFLHGVKSH